MNKKYEGLVHSISDCIGGRDNVEFFTHCITRLRFTVKDKGAVDLDAIKKQGGVINAVWMGDQLQIIIGQEVDDVYQAIAKEMNLAVESTVDENLDEDLVKKEPLTPRAVLKKVGEYLSGCIVQVLPIMIGSGMISMIASVAKMCGVPAENGTVQLLTFVGNAGLYFLPVFLGGFAAKKLGGSPQLGLLLGAVLLHPTFTTAVSSGEALDFLGINVPLITYSNTIIPILISIAAMVPIQRFFAKHSPELLRSILEPTLTLVVMVPLMFLVFGPFGNLVGAAIGTAVNWMYENFGFIGLGCVCAFMPIKIFTGAAGWMMPITLQQFATLGREFIMFNSSIIHNLTEGAICLAVAIKTKNENLRSTCLGCAATAIVSGISEPGMFGVIATHNHLFRIIMVSNFVGGAIVGLTGAGALFMSGTAGVLGIAAYVPGGLGNVLGFVAGLAVSMVLGVVLTLVLYKDE